MEAWILEAGRDLGASPEALAWVEHTLRYAGSNSADHKDHLHIRFEE